MPMLNVDAAVRDRYGNAAQAVEPELCCPVDYDAQYLRVIPAEVIERDYGCGDPSRHVHEGETVLDLGSGGGKICFIAAQKVGPTGRVIGVDTNEAMLELARRSAPVVAEAIGYDNVAFFNGRIQDLGVDRDVVEAYLREHPVTDNASLIELETYLDRLRDEHPMIPDGSIDVVVSNCVLNLVDSAEKQMLFHEIFRVLRPGGRAVISDIVSDREVPNELRQDAHLWSGCLSGAFELSSFLMAFSETGFEDVTLDTLQPEPWQTVEGIEFRSATVIAYRPLHDAHDSCGDAGCQNDADASALEADGIRRVYRGPFQYVVGDDGVMFTRGQVCEDEAAVAAMRPSLADQFVTLGEVAQSPKLVSLPCC